MHCVCYRSLRALAEISPGGYRDAGFKHSPASVKKLFKATMLAAQALCKDHAKGESGVAISTSDTVGRRAEAADSTRIPRAVQRCMATKHAISPRSLTREAHTSVSVNGKVLSVDDIVCAYPTGFQPANQPTFRLAVPAGPPRAPAGVPAAYRPASRLVKRSWKH